MKRKLVPPERSPIVPDQNTFTKLDIVLLDAVTLILCGAELSLGNIKYICFPLFRDIKKLKYMYLEIHPQGRKGYPNSCCYKKAGYNCLLFTTEYKLLEIGTNNNGNSCSTNGYVIRQWMLVGSRYDMAKYIWITHGIYDICHPRIRHMVRVPNLAWVPHIFSSVGLLFNERRHLTTKYREASEPRECVFEFWYLSENWQLPKL